MKIEFELRLDGGDNGWKSGRENRIEWTLGRKWLKRGRKRLERGRGGVLLSLEERQIVESSVLVVLVLHCFVFFWLIVRTRTLHLERQ